MQTVLFVSPLTKGSEQDVLAIHDQLPVPELEQQADVERLRAYIGSGIYALEITVDDGNFQEHFHRFLNMPAVAAFFRELQPHVHNLPRPDEETAAMPLTTLFMEWDRGMGS